MEERDLNQILSGKQRRRHELARMPIEKKLLAVVRLQELAAPILRQRGKTVRCWSAEHFAPRGKPNSDAVRPFRNGSDLVRDSSNRWIVDFGVGTAIEAAALYEAPFKHIEEHVKPARLENNDRWRRSHWWLLGRTLPDFREATARLPRYIGTPRIAKHRVFVWQDSPVFPDSKVIAIAFADEFHFGVLHSRIHETWTLATCGWHGKGNDATYNPTECYETFPFPHPTPAQEAAIADAAKELNEWRERWLNPPEWTVERILEFPGSAVGPWSRYVFNPDKNGIGTVRYPRLEPRDPDCAAKLKKRTLTNLYNERPAWLDFAHKKLDAAVAAAYGWSADLTDEQILERLLALNLERAAEEASAQKSPKRKSAQRDKAEHELI